MFCCDTLLNGALAGGFPMTLLYQLLAGHILLYPAELSTNLSLLALDLEPGGVHFFSIGCGQVMLWMVEILDPELLVFKGWIILPLVRSPRIWDPVSASLF